MFYVYLYQFGIIMFVFYPEAVASTFSLKSCFLKILKNLQEENTCARALFEAPLATSLK